VEAGQRLYAEHCGACHGPAGRGNGPAMPPLSHPAPDLGAPDVQRQPDGALFWKLTTGNSPMPGWNALPERDRWHLVNYLRSLARRG
jgi:mono/diheme cytochrome c family protein